MQVVVVVVQTQIETLPASGVAGQDPRTLQKDLLWGNYANDGGADDDPVLIHLSWVSFTFEEKK